MLSNFAFKFNSRRHTKVAQLEARKRAAVEAEVGRCMMTLWNPC